MERGELIVTTNDPKAVKKVKTGALVGSIAIAALLIWSSLAVEGAAPQTVVFSAVIGVALAAIGVMSFVRPESHCAAYEHGVAGFAARESGTKTDPFELPYEAITELRRFKKRGMEKNLLICTANAQYNVYCRINQEELIQVLVSKMYPMEDFEEE